MKKKLYFGDELDLVLIERDFVTDIDDYFIAKESGRPHAAEFLALEDRIDVPRMSKVISFLKSGPPEIAGAAIELLDFSVNALQNIADTIENVQAEVRAGKVFKAFSIETHYGPIFIARNVLSSGVPGCQNIWRIPACPAKSGMNPTSICERHSGQLGSLVIHVS